MKNLGSKLLVTERLELRPQTMEEQKYLWELLMIPEVNKYFLTVPVKYVDKLNDWNEQIIYYQKEMEHAKDLDVYKWSIFLKETNTCIGRITCQENDIDEKDLSVRGVGWLIDPLYQGKGYGYEAAKAMVDYMFMEVGIKKIVTAAAICNPASWRIMEKLGFLRLFETKMVQYTYLDELIEDYCYVLNRERYFIFNKEEE